MISIPATWCQTTVREITDPYDSIDPARQANRTFRYIDIGSIDNRSQEIAEPKTIVGLEAPSRARRVVRTGDTLFSTVRTYLKNVALVPPDLDGELTSTGIAVLRPSPAVEPNYLFAVARSDAFISMVSVAQDGTMYPAVSDADVMSAPIALPPLDEQRRIVAKIGSLSAKSKRARDRLDRVPTLVKKYKQSILDSAFGGKLVPGSNSVQLRPISELIDRLDQGWSPKCESEPADTDADWAVMKTTAVQPIDFRPEANKRLPASLQPRPELEIRVGDVIITRAGPRSRVAITCVVRATRPKLMLCDKAYRMRMAADRADPYYVGYMLNAPSVVEQLEQLKTGINDSGLNLTQAKFLALELPCPSPELQREIVRRLDVAFAWIDRLAAEANSACKLIDHLDQAVLSKAFQGKLVPQDPADEPASALLARIKAASGGTTLVRKRRGRPRQAALL